MYICIAKDILDTKVKVLDQITTKMTLFKCRVYIQMTLQI